MTCREKLSIEHPECIVDWLFGGCSGCPKDYGYLPDPIGCHGASENGCATCWDREIPEKKYESTCANQAAEHRMIFDSYKKVGFDDRQAFELLKIHIRGEQ